MTNPVDRQAAIAAHIAQDPFARHLGATYEAIEPGYSRVTLTVTETMLNFHGITHGGLVFSLADMAFAAASNAHGQTAVALSMSINFTKATRPGDRLIAEATEVHLGGRTAIYDITVTDGQGNLVAKTQATVYRKRESVLPE